MVKPRLLVTRFAPHAQRLASELNAKGVFALAQPLIAVQKSTEFNNVRFVFTKFYDYIVAVSCNAVNYADQALVGENWPVTCYVAVGKATQKELQRATQQQVVVPNEQFSSEGLLCLPCFNNLQGKRILILRGVGGRELLAEKLIERGAVVEYYQPYQRIAIDLCGAFLVTQWQLQKINGAIISSMELLERLLEIVPKKELNWLKTLTVYVPSRRIAERARLSGWCHTEVLPGMQDQQILDYFN